MPIIGQKKGRAKGFRFETGLFDFMRPSVRSAEVSETSLGNEAYGINKIEGPDHAVSI